MATLSALSLTLLDAVKRREPDGSQAKIVEMLNQTNEVLSDMLWRPSNRTASHMTTLRTSLPTAYFKLMNKGVLPSKSTTAQVEEACAKMELWNQVDADLVEQEEEREAFLMSESRPAIEGLNEKMARYIFYGNRNTEPEAFTGLAPRYNALTGTNMARNVISAGGSGSDLTSIWLVIWGEETIHGIYPKATIGGLQVDDKGKVTSENDSGELLDVYRQKYSWHCGMALRDWRAAARICNIDTSNLASNSSAANLTELMIKAWHAVRPVMRLGKAAFYMNSTVAQYLDLQRLRILNGAGTGQQNLGGAISAEMVDGEMRYSFRGIPIRIVDQLLNTETTIS